MNVSFRRLVRVYIAILAVTTVLVTTMAAFFQIRGFNTTLQQNRNLVMSRVADTVDRYQNITTDFASQLTTSSADVANVDMFFHHSLADYANYAIDQSQSTGQYFFLPNEAQTVMIRNPEIQTMRIQLQNSELTYLVTTENKGGDLRKEKHDISGLTMTAALINPLTLASTGTLSFTFNPQIIKQDLRQIHVNDHVQALVISDTNRLLLHYVDRSVTHSESQTIAQAVSKGQIDDLVRSGKYMTLTEPISGGYLLYVLVNRSAHMNQLVSIVFPIVAVGLLLLLLFVTSFLLTFRRYQAQLRNMIKKMHQIGSGDLGERLSGNGSDDDLNVLANGVNDMLVAINRYVYEIYQLKIAQQEAHMKALQAQINPHFMYNTLEYIRMAALDAGERDLAQVVFSFASLLRNNTDQRPIATLGDELKFVEKYIYLYQVRFPQRLAYQITIDSGLTKLVLPRFSLQPLVENYFVHGVDFAREDNAIAIVAKQVGQRVQIDVVNNGKSLTDKELEQINQRVVAPISGEPESIGLQNVYARLVQYLGDSVSLTLHRNEYNGITTTVAFRVSNGRSGEENDTNHPGG
ncbi:sensor histidine kinase [Schleiferilactobacillus perolens]|uniref:sensor histidine kinase n=1 Tax=Schleiferilactobacillus perolens TaxID=100468 RepID=UPI0039E9A3EE